MVQYRLNIETESRIRWKVYVRFGGEHLEIAHVHMIRRRVLSLRNWTDIFNSNYDITYIDAAIPFAITILSLPKLKG